MAENEELKSLLVLFLGFQLMYIGLLVSICCLFSLYALYLNSFQLLFLSCMIFFSVDLMFIQDCVFCISDMIIISRSSI